MRPFLVYTAARMLLLFAVALLLYAIGLRGLVLAALAVVVSLPLSYVLLARQRIALGADLERRVAARRARSADLRSRLRDDLPADPAASGVDAAPVATAGPVDAAPAAPVVAADPVDAQRAEAGQVDATPGVAAGPGDAARPGGTVAG